MNKFGDGWRGFLTADEEKTLNRKEHPEGSVVYHALFYPDYPQIIFGTVVENYISTIAVQHYTYYERRRVDGIPIDDFPFTTEWRKLPREWTWNYSLFELTENRLPEDAVFDLKDKDDIKRVIDAGYLVPINAIDPCKIEADIGKGIYRIIKKYDDTSFSPWRKPLPNIESIDINEVFGTYEEADARLRAFLAECDRVQNLSDEEWALEEADKHIGFWAYRNRVLPEVKEAARAFVRSLGNIEDVEIRDSGKELQWRYEKQKNWKTFAVA